LFSAFVVVRDISRRPLGIPGSAPAGRPGTTEAGELHFKQLYETIVLKVGNVNPRVSRVPSSAFRAFLIARRGACLIKALAASLRGEESARNKFRNKFQ
jgi:hypothetical protein